jgi:hypothetical protein
MLANFLTLLPLALGIGIGADAQPPLVRSIVGGLRVSTMITLALTPVVFSEFNRSCIERSWVYSLYLCDLLRKEVSSHAFTHRLEDRAHRLMPCQKYPPPLLAV